jgi:hypothetical protein
MTWDDVYREHWLPLVAWCCREYGLGSDPENIAQAAVAAVWRSNRGGALAWPGELVRWHLIRSARDYVDRRPAMFRGVLRKSAAAERLFLTAADYFPGRAAADSVAEFLPDDFPADERAVVIAACDGGMSLRDIEGGGGKLVADRLWRRAVRRLQKSSQLARDYAGVN